VAARLAELDIEVDTVHGRYGEYKVLVDGDTWLTGILVALGVFRRAEKSLLPSGRLGL
jgi:hypothetical protein